MMYLDLIAFTDDLEKRKMYAVGISLGHTSAYVAVAGIPSVPITDFNTDVNLPSIKVVANSAGHRNTPPVCAFTDGPEILFGETAHHSYARQPNNVVPSVFTYAAVENSLRGANTSEKSETARNFLDLVRRYSAVKFKGHKSFEDEESNMGFSHDFNDNGNDISRVLSATSVFVQFLNHIKQHSVDGPCSLNLAEKPTKSIVLTVVAPRYAFPLMSNDDETNKSLDWVTQAVKDSNFSGVAAHVAVVFSDEAALLGLDATGSSSTNYIPFLLPKPEEENPTSEKTDRGESVLVVDWGAQDLNLTMLHCADGTIVRGPSKATPHYTMMSSSSSPSGGEVLDVVLADRVAANFILQKRQIFQSKIPQFMSAMQPRKEVLGKTHPIVTEHIPARAMRQLRTKIEEKKMALLGKQQMHTVSVEVEAFYDGFDLLDNQTLNRQRLEMALRSDWGLVEKFQRALEEFLNHEFVQLDTAFQSISRVILCGGMCQISAFSATLEKVIRQVASSRKEMSNDVEVLDVGKVGGTASADEIFAVGGCLQSYFAGLAYVAGKLSKKSTPKSGKNVRSSKTAFSESLSLTWSKLDQRSGISTEFLSSNIYLYTLQDTTLLNDIIVSSVLPASAVSVLFPRLTAIPSRVALEWPSEVKSTGVLYLLVDKKSKKLENGFHGLSPLVPKGVMVKKPYAKEEHKAFILFTLLNDSNELRLRVNTITAKGEDVPAFVSPGSIMSSLDIVLTKA